MTIAVTDYTDAAQMRADYAARRARLYGTSNVSIVEREVAPEPSALEAEKEDAVRSCAGSSWTKEEDAELRRGVARKQTAAEISQYLPRTHKAIVGRARKLGLSISNPKPPKAVKPKEEALRDAIELYRLAVDLTNNTKGQARQIMRAVAESSGLTLNDLTAQCRDDKIVTARHKAIWLIARETGLSYESIGRLFGGRDQTTIINAVRRHNACTGENVRNAGLPR